MAESSEDVSKLEFTVFNSGKMPINLEPGAPIARIVLVQVGPSIIKSVDKFPENEPTFKVNDTSSRNTSRQNDSASFRNDSVLKADDVWFRRLLRDDREATLNRFFLDTEGLKFLSKIEEMRTTNEFLVAIDPSMFEAKWIWKNMPDTIRIRVANEFKTYKRDAYKNIQAKSEQTESASSYADDDNVEIKMEDLDNIATQIPMPDATTSSSTPAVIEPASEFDDLGEFDDLDLEF